MLRFRDSDHRYEEIGNPQAVWSGVTTLLKKFEGAPFDPSIADKNSLDPESKWFGIEPDLIRTIWKEEAERSTVLGSWYHHTQESEDFNTGGIQCCPLIDDWKYASDQKLTEGVHPEFLLYHPLYRVCGQADRLKVTGNVLSIRDYKSNKVLNRKSWNGKTMMSPPVSHLQKCHLSTYNLQLSMYLFIALYHNPHLVPGDIELYHVKFNQVGENKWGYPIYEEDEKGGWVVKDVEVIKLPYLQKEVELILEHHKKSLQ